MTVQRATGTSDRFTGLSTDTKPVTGSVGDEFIETDTGDWYKHDGSTWRKHLTVAADGSVAELAIPKDITFDDGVLPQDSYETKWMLGDSATAVSIAASGTQATSAWEIGKIRKDESTIVIIVGGTGTAKLDANISRDGVNDKVTVAAATLSLDGLTAGTYSFDLDHASLPYGHYLDFLITETGGANAVTVQVFGMGRNG